MKIGIIYDRIEDYKHIDGPEDRFDEFEPTSTIEAMKDAVKKAGHSPVDIGSPHNLLSPPDIDLAWNIAEGYGTRNREAWAPVLLEIHDIPVLGSDAATLSVSLDKHLSRLIARSSGIPVAWGESVSKPEEMQEVSVPAYPLLLKPRFEGTAKGINPNSIVNNREELDKKVPELIKTYDQDVLIEQFLPGAEFTCLAVGSPLRCLPVIQRSVDRESRLGVHALAGVGEVSEGDQILPGLLDDELEQLLISQSLKMCRDMKVRHFARIDFKMDEFGQPFFMEINPLPTFAVDSTFAVIAEMEGKSYISFLADLLNESIEDVYSS